MDPLAWCAACRLGQAHEHGPCAHCVFFARHRLGDPLWRRLPVCLHPTGRETQERVTGPQVVWLDPQVRNAGQTCPHFVRVREEPPAVTSPEALAPAPLWVHLTV